MLFELLLINRPSQADTYRFLLLICSVFPKDANVWMFFAMQYVERNYKRLKRLNRKILPFICTPLFMGYVLKSFVNPNVSCNIYQKVYSKTDQPKN